MRTLYLECFSGISGDMSVAALLDAGASERGLREMLESLKVEGFHIEIGRTDKNGIDACSFHVILQEHNTGESAHIHHLHDHHEQEHEHRGIAEIAAIIEKSSLTQNARHIAKAVFNVLAKAEGKVHGKPPEEVRFHEVGAVDSIVDILSVAYCIDNLGIERIVSSPLSEGTGTVECQHGTIPVPAPATAELARMANIPMQITQTEGEMVTPTGAAIVAALSQSFAPVLLENIISIGIGAGKKNFKHANILRAYIFDAPEEQTENGAEVSEIVTAVDDMTPEAMGFLMDRLFEAGALDVYFVPAFMKKNRPAYEIKVLCAPEKQDACIHCILKHSSTIGLRVSRVDRVTMDREVCFADTKYGKIAMKWCSFGDIEKYSVEYESAAEAAKQAGCSLEQVYRAAYADESR